MSTPSQTLLKLDQVKSAIQKTSLTDLVNHDYIKHSLGLHFGSDSAKKVEQFRANYLVLVSDKNVIKNLENADKFSILNSLINLTKDGLSINPYDKEACIVNYGGVATAIPMAKGKIKKMQQAGIIDRIQYLEVVYEGDTIKNKNGVWEHEINIKLTGKEKKLGVLLLVLMPDRTVRSKFVRAFEVEKRKKKSKMAAMWTEWEEEMWKKTAVNMFEKEIGSKPLFQFTDDSQEDYEQNQIEDVSSEDVTVKERDIFTEEESTQEEVITQDPVLVKNLDELIAEGLLNETELSKLNAVKHELDNTKLTAWISSLTKRKEIRDSQNQDNQPPI